MKNNHIFSQDSSYSGFQHGSKCSICLWEDFHFILSLNCVSVLRENTKDKCGMSGPGIPTLWQHHPHCTNQGVCLWNIDISEILTGHFFALAHVYALGLSTLNWPCTIFLHQGQYLSSLALNILREAQPKGLQPCSNDFLIALKSTPLLGQWKDSGGVGVKEK